MLVAMYSHPAAPDYIDNVGDKRWFEVKIDENMIIGTTSLQHAVSSVLYLREECNKPEVTEETIASFEWRKEIALELGKHRWL